MYRSLVRINTVSKEVTELSSPAASYLMLKSVSQVSDIRIKRKTEVDRRCLIFTGAAAAESSDNTERLEESKVIMGNWLPDPEHLAGSDPLVSLLSEWLLHSNWLRRKSPEAWEDLRLLLRNRTKSAPSG